MSRKFEMSLDTDDIDRVIGELTQYKDNLQEKCNKLRQRIANYVETLANQYYSGLPEFENFRRINRKQFEQIKVKPAPITTSVRMQDENLTVVIASGEDILWVQFGTGVKYNSPVGTSLHPAVTNAEGDSELAKYTIGTYGHGNGAKTFWNFPSEDGSSMGTHGYAASCFLYRAAHDATTVETIMSIAEDVFKND